MKGHHSSAKVSQKTEFGIEGAGVSDEEDDSGSAQIGRTAGEAAAKSQPKTKEKVLAAAKEERAPTIETTGERLVLTVTTDDRNSAPAKQSLDDPLKGKLEAEVSEGSDASVSYSDEVKELTANVEALVKKETELEISALKTHLRTEIATKALLDAKMKETEAATRAAGTAKPNATAKLAKMVATTAATAAAKLPKPSVAAALEREAVAAAREEPLPT